METGKNEFVWLKRERQKSGIVVNYYLCLRTGTVRMVADFGDAWDYDVTRYKGEIREKAEEILCQPVPEYEEHTSDLGKQITTTLTEANWRTILDILHAACQEKGGVWVQWQEILDKHIRSIAAGARSTGQPIAKTPVTGDSPPYEIRSQASRGNYSDLEREELAAMELGIELGHLEDGEMDFYD